MAWDDLWAALALVMVLEGILPFLNPPRWRRHLKNIAGLEDRTLRQVGLFSMLVGVVILYAVRGYFEMT